MDTSAAPPPIIDSALLLCFARVGADVHYSGRIHLCVGDLIRNAAERVGAVPCLAICKNLHNPEDILLLFCRDDWSSIGVIAFSSVEEAKLQAEIGYPGIRSHWEDSHYDADDVAQFVRHEYSADPNTEWWRTRCSFCQKDVSEACVSKRAATICASCIDRFHAALHDDA